MATFLDSETEQDHFCIKLYIKKNLFLSWIDRPRILAHAIFVAHAIFHSIRIKVIKVLFFISFTR